MSDGEVRPEDYTWQMVSRDLALSTGLTLTEAGQLVDGLVWPGIKGQVAITAYDALPLLIGVVRGIRGEGAETISRAGYCLRRIIVNEPKL